MAKDPAKTSHHKWEFPERPWQCLRIDYASPFLDHMWFNIVSKWPIVIPTKNTSAENTTEMLLDTFAIHRFCEQVVSDNGSQFTSEFSKISANPEVFNTSSLHCITSNQMVRQKDLFRLSKQQ